MQMPKGSSALVNGYSCDKKVSFNAKISLQTHPTMLFFKVHKESTRLEAALEPTYFALHLGKHKAVKDEEGDTRECQHRFLQLRSTEAATRPKGWKSLFQSLTALGTDGKAAFEPECDHLQPIVLPKPLFEDLDKGELAVRIIRAKRNGMKLVLSVTGEGKCWDCAREEPEDGWLPEVDLEEDDWEWWVLISCTIIVKSVVLSKAYSDLDYNIPRSFFSKFYPVA
jgi:hypothetical protein